MNNKLKYILVYFIIAVTAVGILISTSVYFGFPFSFMPIKIDTINLFTTYIGSDTPVYLCIKWENTSLTKIIDYIELEITPQNAGNMNESIRVRVDDGGPVAPHSSNYIWSYYLPELTNCELYNIHIDKIVYADGGIWNSKNKVKDKILRLNSEKEDDIFPAAIEQAIAYHESGSDEIKYKLLWDTLNAKELLFALVVKISCYDSNGKIVSCDGSECYYSILMDENYETDELYPLESWETFSDYCYVGELVEGVEAIKVSIVKAVDCDGNVYISEEEPEMTLNITGKKEYLFESSTDNESICRFINKMESNFKEVKLHYSDPLVYVSDEYAIIRYPDIDVRIELDDNLQVKDGEVSCVKYMDFNNNSEYAVIGLAQSAIFSASMKNIPYTESIKTQFKDLFIAGREGYVDTTKKTYHYHQPYKHYLKDNSTGILTCAMGENLYYLAPEFYSDVE